MDIVKEHLGVTESEVEDTINDDIEEMIMKFYEILWNQYIV